MLSSEVKQTAYAPRYKVSAVDVLAELKKYMLVDGYDFVLDLDNSKGANFIEARTGKRYLDFFTCFASMPIGMNHPKLLDEGFRKYINRAATNKVSNSDIYTDVMATFVKTFFEIAVPKTFKYSFFISGGALAVENALKAAFDWKVRKNLKNKKTKGELGHQIIHFKQAFHGRSGYTMSLTNTDPNKVLYYPKFNWPRVSNPYITFPLDDKSLEDLIKREKQSIEEMKAAFKNNPNDIAGIIIEPIQGEGGDHHFRPEFFKQMRQLADENEALLIFDEVQTGLGITGTMWAHEQLGITPDIMCFGKKMQICGIVATDRLDEVSDNVFRTSSRINSTWGGNLTDMARSTRYLEIIDEENLLENVKQLGKELDDGLMKIQNDYPELISNTRGMGLFRAFDFKKELRADFIKKCFEEGLMILPCGTTSVRFRPPLNLKKNQLEEGIAIVRKVIDKLKK